jgi:hypothetical protein
MLLCFPCFDRVIIMLCFLLHGIYGTYGCDGRSGTELVIPNPNRCYNSCF